MFHCNWEITYVLKISTILRRAARLLIIKTGESLGSFLNLVMADFLEVDRIKLL